MIIFLIIILLLIYAHFLFSPQEKTFHTTSQKKISFDDMYKSNYFNFRDRINQSSHPKEDPVDRIGNFDPQKEITIMDAYDKLTKN